MIDIINTVAQRFLDTGLVESGYSILEHGEKQVSAVKSIGNIEVTDLEGNRYLVEYESLIPIHGSGVDDIYIIHSVNPLFSET